ncbi:MAG: ABC transporter permease subunit [Anaerolineae bacterium]|nr:ABC transporter permease subunit [Anaerolineae bacterium]
MTVMRLLARALGIRWGSHQKPLLRLRGRLRWSAVVGNGPLLVGLVVVSGLLVVALFGPRFASENPYLSAQRATELVDGRLQTPPFAPSAQFPLGSDRWGRDLLSLLLYGARNTLVACLFVTMVRLGLGLALGSLAGWRSGTWLDRLIMGAVEILASLPILITGMILIYALDIRRGLVVFMAALSLVGWGEIAQYTRSEFIALRQQPFIEGARAVGLTEAQVATRHILPNVLPQLVSLALLEMGAVLMLLGELGFVGVFIGGGTETTDATDAALLIADIPEWGAILSGARSYLRSAPGLVLFPSLAFMISVLGFNFLGEGLRRLTREAGINTAALVSKRMGVVVIAICLVTWGVVQGISPRSSYAQLASRFDGERALTHAQEILRLQQGDPGFGTQGARQAAEYIAAELRAAGAGAGAEGSGYLQAVTRRLAPRLATPELVGLGNSGQVAVRLTHGVDFGEQVYGHGGSGICEAPLTFVGFPASPHDYAAWRGLNLDGQVAVYLADEAPPGFDREALLRGALALLVLTDEIAPHNDWGAAGGSFMETPTLPILHVRPDAYDQLVGAEGATVSALRAVLAAFRRRESPPPWVAIPLRTRVRVRVELAEPIERTGYNILAILPGQDTALDDQALLLSTHYDLPEPNPTGAFLDASSGPAGVGAILEMMRLWQQAEFKPRRAILIGIWAGGHLTSSGATTYAQSRTPYGGLDRRAVLHLGAIGSAGAEEVNGEQEKILDVSAPDPEWQSLLLRSAHVVGLSAQSLDTRALSYMQTLPGGVLAWRGAPHGYPAGKPATLSATALAQAGEVANLALITASRQYHY